MIEKRWHQTRNHKVLRDFYPIIKPLKQSIVKLCVYFVCLMVKKRTLCVITTWSKQNPMLLAAHTPLNFKLDIDCLMKFSNIKDLHFFSQACTTNRPTNISYPIIQELKRSLKMMAFTPCIRMIMGLSIKLTPLLNFNQFVTLHHT